jgi:hypothetical protein
MAEAGTEAGTEAGMEAGMDAGDDPVSDEAADLIVVPHVVGMPFHIARDLAAEKQLALAGVDPDGPSIGSQAWPGLFYVTAQDPTAGSRLRRWASIRVTVIEWTGSPR